MFDRHQLGRVAEGIKTNVRGGAFVDVEIVMRPPDEHDMTAAELIDLWRNEIGEIPGVYQMTFEAESGPGGWRKDIAVDLSHDDVDVLERAMRAFVERAESFTNAVDVSDNFNRGKKQIDFTLRPEGRALGLTWQFEGSTADMQESMQSLAVSFALAMLAIYALLALAFGNYVQPFIVLVAIPFGAIGAVLGHMILGYDLSLISLMGMIALAGVVVNDSLIMVDYANRRRSEHSAFDAIHQAGIRRFRPIVLTTLTTAGGLIPIIAERSLQAQYLIPMAISLGFGIVFGTAIILLLVPCLYLILDDLKALVARRKHA